MLAFYDINTATLRPVERVTADVAQYLQPGDHDLRGLTVRTTRIGSLLSVTVSGPLPIVSFLVCRDEDALTRALQITGVTTPLWLPACLVQHHGVGDFDDFAIEVAWGWVCHLVK